MADMGQQARASAADAAEHGKSMLSRQKEAAADRVEQVAHAVRSGARELQGSDEAGRYVEKAAERLESFGRQLREKDLNGLIADAQDMARRSPAAFFGGTVLAGFLLARFMKSTAADRGGEAWRPRSPADTADAGGEGWSHPQWSSGPEEVGTPTPTSFTGSETTGGSHGQDR